MDASAVVEPQDFIIQALRGYSLQSPVGLIRMMIQQSNCFIVVERGAAMWYEAFSLLVVRGSSRDDR